MLPDSVLVRDGRDVSVIFTFLATTTFLAGDIGIVLASTISPKNQILYIIISVIICIICK